MHFKLTNIQGHLTGQFIVDKIILYNAGPNFEISLINVFLILLFLLKYIQ